MWHTAFIVLHAAAATGALTAGLVALPAGRLFGLYRWALVGLMVFLLPALAIDWMETDRSTKLIRVALLVLGAVMFVRATRAGRMLPATTGGPSAAYLDHVGFGVIALSVAFAVTAVLRTGAPGWLVVVAGVGVVAVGYVWLGAAKARLVHKRDAGESVRSPPDSHDRTRVR